MTLTKIVQQQHYAMEQLFSQHQRALLTSSFDKAIMLLDHYLLYCRVHMRLEERYLFPAFSRLERESQWGTDLYEKEHRKMCVLLERLVQRIHWLKKQQCSNTERENYIIALLDQEKTVKGLTAHHEKREEQGMLAELDKKLGEGQKKRIISDFKFAWIEAKAAIEIAPIKK